MSETYTLTLDEVITTGLDRDAATLLVAEALGGENADHALAQAALIVNRCLYLYHPNHMKVWARGKRDRQIDVAVTAEAAYMVGSAEFDA